MNYFLVMSLVIASVLIHPVEGQDEDVKKFAATLTASYRDFMNDSGIWWSFEQVILSSEIFVDAITLKAQKLIDGKTILYNHLIVLQKSGHHIRMKYFNFTTAWLNTVGQEITSSEMARLSAMDLIYEHQICEQLFKLKAISYGEESRNCTTRSEVILFVSCKYLVFVRQSDRLWSNFENNYGNPIQPRWKPCSEYCPEDHDTKKLAAFFTARFQGILDDVAWDFQQVKLPDFFYGGCPAISMKMATIDKGTYLDEYLTLVDKVNQQLRLRIYSFSDEWIARRSRSTILDLKNLTRDDIMFLNCTITFTYRDFETFIANDANCKNKINKVITSVNCRILTIYQFNHQSFYSFERLHKNYFLPLWSPFERQCCPYTHHFHPLLSINIDRIG